MEDREIVELYWQRAEQALNETSRKYGGYLRRIAWNILQDDADAEECVNDAYLGRGTPSRPTGRIPCRCSWPASPAISP